MADTGNFESNVTTAARKNRRARDADIPLGDVFVEHSYIFATFGRGYGRTSIWRRIREGNFPKPTLIGNQNKWRKSVIDAHRDALIPPKSNE